MNNKAFTLVELIAIVLILSLIALVSFPTILGIAKSDNEKKLTNMIDNLCSAGKTYIYSNQELYPEISTPYSIINISVNDLIQYGIVDKNLKNPETNESVLQDGLMYTVKNDNSLDCEYLVGGSVDLTEYFSITDFKFCKDVVFSNGSFTCDSSKAEYTSKTDADQDENDNKVCVLGSTDNSFFSIINWTFDYSDYDGIVRAGDYVNIPLYENTYSEPGSRQQRLMSGGTTSSNDLIVQGIKVGTWRIVDDSSKRTLQVLFTDGITELIKSASTESISGQFKTPNIFSVTLNHVETRDVTMTAGNYSKALCVLKSTPKNPLVQRFGYSYNGISNNYVRWRIISTGITFTSLCEAFENGGVIPDSSIYDNLHLEVNLGTNSDYKLDITARISGLDFEELPTSIKPVNTHYTLSINNFFTKDKNPAANYATLAEYRENIAERHYGLYVDRTTGDGVLIINLGDQPSKTITYTDVIRSMNPNCASYGCGNVGSHLKWLRPFTINSTQVDGFNNVYGSGNASKLGHGYSGGNVIAYSINLTQYFDTVSEPTSVEISPVWYWGSDLSNTDTRTASAILQPAQSVSSN